MSLTICVLYHSSVKESPQARALNQAVGQRRKADGQHHSAESADDHRADVSADAAAGLIQLSGLVHGLYARISQRHDLTPVQAKLLCIVAENPRGMAELAQCFGVEKAALTGLVARREYANTVQRPAGTPSIAKLPSAAVRV